MHRRDRQYRARLNGLRWLSLLGMLLAALVVLAGAWTRLVDAGLGCPDWPGCYGQWVVPDQSRALMHSPDVPLDASKAWMEMLHRYLASSLGLLAIAVVVLGRRLRHHAGYPWRLSLGLLTLILVQGAFGAFTVTLRLWPQVVTLHLLGGMSVMGSFLWLYLRLRHLTVSGMARRQWPRRLTPLWGLALVLLVLQLGLGGWTSSNYAGLACQGFPTCNAQWWPNMDWGEGFHLTQTVGPNYLHGQLHGEARSAIQMGHRLGGVALFLCLLGLGLRHRRDRGVSPWLGAMGGACLLQAALGIANVLFWLPLWLALLHTAGAAVLVTATLLAVWHWRWGHTVARSSPSVAARELMHA